jgi:predicted phage tail protein
MDEEVIARSIDKLAEAMQSVADEIKEFRHDLREEWLRIIVQTDITEEGRIRYEIK